MSIDSASRVGHPAMRPLVIDEAAIRTVAAVRIYAEKPAHVYRPGQTPPGTIEGHVCQLNTYRCVFSITEVESGAYRHLSISVPGGAYPHPFACWTIAGLFGFSGWDGADVHPAASWQVAMHKDEHCIVIAQPL